MTKQEINSLVVSYQVTKEDETFTNIYREVSKEWRNLDTVAKSVMSQQDEILSVYEDTLIRCIDRYDGRGDFINFLKRSLRFARRDMYKHKKRRYGYEAYDKEDEELSRIAAVEDLTEKKEAEQRQLIDFLLDGADETTTAIVEAFINHPKPTATAIAKELGYHHTKVTRALTRLASKFDEKQFGSYSDFLIAQ